MLIALHLATSCPRKLAACEKYQMLLGADPGMGTGNQIFTCDTGHRTGLDLSESDVTSSHAR